VEIKDLPKKYEGGGGGLVLKETVIMSTYYVLVKCLLLEALSLIFCLFTNCNLADYFYINQFGLCLDPLWFI
jgi:hypothetical protein